MRFNDIMRYVPVNEDWEGRSGDERAADFNWRLRRSIGKNRAQHQFEFERERQRRLGGDLGDIDKYRNGPTEREFREKNLNDILRMEHELSKFYEKQLRPAKMFLGSCYPYLRGALDSMGYDMSAVGRRVAPEVRELASAVKNAYDAIVSLERLL